MATAAVCVMICVATFCIGGKCSVVLCLKNRKYGGVSSLSYQSSDTCNLYAIKASVIRDIETNRLGNNYITGFTTDDANDLLSTLCTD